MEWRPWLRLNKVRKGKRIRTKVWTIQTGHFMKQCLRSFRRGLAVGSGAFICTVTFGLVFINSALLGAPTRLVGQAPVAVTEVAQGVYLVDFGRVAFGNLLLAAPKGASDVVTVRMGEALKDGRVDRNPPGSVRYAEVRVSLHSGQAVIAAPTADARNTKPKAVLTPAPWGVVIPFRWVEVEGWPGELRADDLRRRAAFDATWEDDAAEFHSSDAMLDRLWELSHYSIKATTFAGVFVDGDRERLAYEADAYLAQLGYYAGDANPQMARDTFDRLVTYPTWPTEWAPHMVFMAYADWKETGDRAWLAAKYKGLKGKLLLERAGPDGLIVSSPERIKHGDLVDWPGHERDKYAFTPINTVVNAFHLRALAEMREMAAALGNTKDAAEFAERERKTSTAFQDKLFDPARGLYRDGVGTEHASLHANLFPLAFGLVPEADRRGVAQWLVGRGMACSVYAAQYLLEGLFENGEDAAAIALMIAPGDRSWRHMVDSGTTITWEAWDQKYKPNQDWNHAWGAAPANLLPRFVLGMQALSPGWERAIIEPHPGGLTYAEGKIPTPRGSVSVAWKRNTTFSMRIVLPAGMTAKVSIPAVEDSQGVWVNSKPAKAHKQDG